VRCFVTGKYDGRRAVAEESGGDDVGHGAIVLLPG
jgi:hypothetical protein